MDSILTSIKKLLGISKEYQHFDDDLIMHINSVFLILNQLGVGPSAGFFIFDKEATWNDFIDDSNLALVKSYMALKVKLLFDPPISSAAIESANKLISEFEWRLSIAAEDVQSSPGGSDGTDVDRYNARLGDAVLGFMKLGYN